MDNIVGILWNKNEGDILEEVILKALQQVDSLFCADDGSIDNSWDIMQRLYKTHKDKIEHIQRAPNRQDPAQRQALLDEVRKRYKEENTWIQVIESDLIIIDTDLKASIKKYSRENVMLNWTMLNGVRPNWDGADNYPNWTYPITEVLTHAHYFEQGPWTYRPLKHLSFDPYLWRPWPKGFSKYLTNKKEPVVPKEEVPLMGHFGYRGPTHIYTKYVKAFPGRKTHPKYTSWNFSSISSVAKTVPYFNGTYNSNSFKFSREGFIGGNS